jgi:hypothetical protein
MDELARRANMDPVAFRLGMLDGTPRLKAALKLVADARQGLGEPQSKSACVPAPRLNSAHA